MLLAAIKRREWNGMGWDRREEGEEKREEREKRREEKREEREKNK